MEAIQETKRRIRSIIGIRQITSAMELISVSRLKRLESKIKVARPYTESLQEMMENLASAVPAGFTHPLIDAREPKNLCLVVITGDRGLCGAYNTNIIQSAHNFIKENPSKELKLVLIGKKGYDFFKNKPCEIIKNYPQFQKEITLPQLREIVSELIEGYCDKKFDEVHLFFTKFSTAIHTMPTRLKLLPLLAYGEKKEGIQSDYIYEPSAKGIWESLLPKYIETQVYRTILESMTSEQGARMVAMKSATENAKDLVSDLTLAYNRARQAVITKEIVEIITAVEALKYKKQA
jgi:F-type H+-transporting ATPase subunit gamma